ncbi:MAG TPA: hypothetical protein VE861_11455, partial [Gemmatimonadaceae bacterium]|nr:hypothetical protein [Gemmatimonadaceae bacterium]
PLATPSSPGGAGFVVRAVGAGGATLIDSASLLGARSLLLSLRTVTHARDGQLRDSVQVNVGVR